ncbi:MAG: electron transport complex subunit E [Candidatus Omnitrophica bacterium]|nr:electron transport complex subunit E [Candidatus Omnitrophota bacterium]
MKKLFREFSKGIRKENPIFGLALGLCPTLAVSTSVINGLGMGLAATFVLLGSNVIISSLRKIIPHQVRIPCFIVVIAGFVTIVELVMAAYFPALSRQLGIFVPLIVVNCIIMCRAEAFASRNTVGRSLFDALGMGAGFTLGLVLISGIREALGSGRLFGYVLFPGYQPALTLALAPGALLILGLLLGLSNLIFNQQTSRRTDEQTN